MSDSIVVSIGALVGAGKGLNDGLTNLAGGVGASNGNGVQGVASGIMGIMGAFTAPGTPLHTTSLLTSPLYSALDVSIAYQQYQDAVASGNDDAIISAYLGFASALGGLLATVPLPQAKALGIVLNLGADALKTSWDNGWRPYGTSGVYTPPPNYPPVIPGDANGNGIPDIHESTISQAVATTFTASTRYTQPRRDPLTFDLDGDGLETVGTAAGILFDHDADGVKTGTGWVKADDALLVRDQKQGSRPKAGVRSCTITPNPVTSSYGKTSSHRAIRRSLSRDLAW